jgi:hypothetical protein
MWGSITTFIALAIAFGIATYLRPKKCPHIPGYACDCDYIKTACTTVQILCTVGILVLLAISGYRLDGMW